MRRKVSQSKRRSEMVASLPVFCVDYNDKLDMIVSGSADTTVKIWCLSSAECLVTRREHTDWVTKVSHTGCVQVCSKVLPLCAFRRLLKFDNYNAKLEALLCLSFLMQFWLVCVCCLLYFQFAAICERR